MVYFCSLLSAERSQQWKPRLLETVIQRAVEESSSIMCRIIEILPIVIRCSRREVVSVHSRELQSARAQRDVMVELLVGALSICATPQTESHVSIGKRIAKVGKYKATVGHFHATPQMVVLQVGSKMYLC